MRATVFFKKLSSAKLTLLATTPILTLALSMKSILLTLIFLVFVDMITGIRKSLHLKKLSRSIFKIDFWRNLKSSGLRRTWRKTYEYGIGVLVFMCLDLYVLKVGPFDVFGSERSISELAVAIGCIIEVWSIFENMEAVSGNNILKKSLDLLPIKIKSFIEGVVKSK